ncbi:alpha/beta hydrolase [Butyrivibrio sp. FCS006]|uniref:alpha/beta hydrolase n=1 Tax=Butyrivibrio sp. FCS006 TaxID=1280684 RepID=UPI0004100334|nr:alpha/beta hydrolase [Butyrivibrio sp. FCS006]
MTGQRQTLEEAFDWQKDHYDTSFYDPLEKTEYTIEGHDGYVLHALFLKNPSPSDKYMIISHGYTDNRNGDIKYVKMYLDYGFNCVLYDLRGHGKNAPTCTTYGIYEAKDLCKVIEDTRKRYDNIAVLGIHGESLGAATSITALKYKPEIDFVVADCGFSDIENVLRGAYKSRKLPEWLFNVADLGARMRFHLSLKDMRPIDSLPDNTLPIIFIHGAEDDFILPKNSEDMKKATAGYAEIYMIPGAGHAESIIVGPDAYREHIGNFLEKVLR